MSSHSLRHCYQLVLISMVVGGLMFGLTRRSPAATHQALQFGGTGQNDQDRVKIPLDGPINVGNQDFTIEWWMRARLQDNPASGCTDQADAWITGNIMIDRDVYGPGDYGDFGIAMMDGAIAVGVHNGSQGATLCGQQPVADDRWHHIAVTREAGTGLIQLFVDGVLDQSLQGPPGDISYRNNRQSQWPNSDPFLVIGAEKHDAGPAYPSYRGWFDELRISTTIRYNQAFSRPTAPFVSDIHTVGLYHCDEGSGTILYDSSAHPAGAAHGTIRYRSDQLWPQWAAATPWEQHHQYLALLVYQGDDQ